MINFTGFYTQKLKSYKNSVNGFLPNHVVIPLMQDGKFECEAIVKPGDKVWQIAFGSGLKCNSCVWKKIN